MLLQLAFIGISGDDKSINGKLFVIWRPGLGTAERLFKFFSAVECLCASLLWL